MSSLKYFCNLGNSLLIFSILCYLKIKVTGTKELKRGLEAKKAFKMHFKDRQECEMEWKIKFSLSLSLSPSLSLFVCYHFDLISFVYASSFSIGRAEKSKHTWKYCLHTSSCQAFLGWWHYMLFVIPGLYIKFRCLTLACLCSPLQDYKCC